MFLNLQIVLAAFYCFCVVFSEEPPDINRNQPDLDLINTFVNNSAATGTFFQNVTSKQNSTLARIINHVINSRLKSESYETALEKFLVSHRKLQEKLRRRHAKKLAILKKALKESETEKWSTVLKESFKNVSSSGRKEVEDKVSLADQLKNASSFVTDALANMLKNKSNTSELNFLPWEKKNEDPRVIFVSGGPEILKESFETSPSGSRSKVGELSLVDKIKNVNTVITDAVSNLFGKKSNVTDERNERENAYPQGVTFSSEVTEASERSTQGVTGPFFSWVTPSQVDIEKSMVVTLENIPSSVTEGATSDKIASIVPDSAERKEEMTYVEGADETHFSSDVIDESAKAPTFSTGALPADVYVSSKPGNVYGEPSFSRESKVITINNILEPVVNNSTRKLSKKHETDIPNGVYEVNSTRINEDEHSLQISTEKINVAVSSEISSTEVQSSSAIIENIPNVDDSVAKSVNESKSSNSSGDISHSTVLKIESSTIYALQEPTSISEVIFSTESIGNIFRKTKNGPGTVTTVVADTKKTFSEMIETRDRSKIGGISDNEENLGASHVINQVVNARHSYLTYDIALKNFQDAHKKFHDSRKPVVHEQPARISIETGAKFSNKTVVGITERLNQTGTYSKVHGINNFESLTNKSRRNETVRMDNHVVGGTLITEDEITDGSIKPIIIEDNFTVNVQRSDIYNSTEANIPLENARATKDEEVTTLPFEDNTKLNDPDVKEDTAAVYMVVPEMGAPSFKGYEDGKSTDITVKLTTDVSTKEFNLTPSEDTENKNGDHIIAIDSTFSLGKKNAAVGVITADRTYSQGSTETEIIPSGSSTNDGILINLSTTDHKSSKTATETSTSTARLDATIIEENSKSTLTFGEEQVVSRDKSDDSRKTDLNGIKAKVNESHPDERNNIDVSYDEASAPLWHSYDANFATFEREELKITKIVLDSSFVLGNYVKEWRSVQVGIQTFMIGVSKDGVVLVKTEMLHGQLAHSVTHALPSDVSVDSCEAFNIWDDSSKTLVTVVLLSVKNEIMWYQINKNDQLDHLWTWKLHEHVTFLKYFEFEMQHYVLALNKDKPTVHIYQFSIEQSHFWLAEHFNLDCFSEVADLCYVRNDLYLSIPQSRTGEVRIFKYNHGHFEHFKTIFSAGVQSVGAFQVGFKHFIAVGGNEHAVYEFTNDGLVAQSILDYSFGRVLFYLPIYIKNYRDDLILLVQHELDYTTHKSIMLDALIWNGVGFVPSSQIPCDFYGVITFGFSCLLDEQTSTGIIGASVLNIGRSVYVVTPRIETHSGLYEIQIELSVTSSPIQKEIKQLMESKEEILRMLLRHNEVLAKSQNYLSNVLHLDSDNFITGKWEVEELRTPVVYDSDNVQWPDGFIQLDNVRLTKKSSSIEIPMLVSGLEEIVQTTDHLTDLLEDTIPKTEQLVQLEFPLKVNGDVEINGDLVGKTLSVDVINGENGDTFLKTYGVSHLEGKYSGKVTLDDVNVQNLIFESVNGIPASHIAYGPECVLNGNILFEDEVHVLGNVNLMENGRINNYKLREMIMDLNQTYDKLQFEAVAVAGNTETSELNNFKMDQESVRKMFGHSSVQQEGELTIQNLNMNGHLTFDKINGVDWNEFIHSVIFKNIPSTILDSIEVVGNVIVPPEVNLTVNSLNGLLFPGDYVFTSSPQPVVISGAKRFIGAPLQVNEVDSEGPVDGCLPGQALTLEGLQNIPGITKFDNLQVSEGLDVEGSISGKNLDAFLANPTLTSTNSIPSNVIFKHLVVQGVTSLNTINKTTLNDIMDDVVLKAGTEIKIDSFKRFLGDVKVQNGLQIKSNLLNGRHLDTLVTKNTDQTLTLEQLVGNVVFKDVVLGGLFNHVNVTDLNVNTVKLQGDQHVSSDIIFNNTDLTVSDFQANNLNVDILGGVTAASFVLTTDTLNFDKDVVFEKLLVDELFVTGEFITNNVISSINLTDFDQRRLSLTRAQNVTGEFYIDKGYIDGNLDANLVNGYPMEEIVSTSSKLDNIHDMLLNGELSVEQLVVNGSLTTGGVNGHNLYEISKNAIWLNKKNIVNGDVIFMDQISANEIKAKGLVHGKYFDGVIEDLALKSPQLVLEGLKTYTAGIKVENNVVTGRINEIRTENIMTKSGVQSLQNVKVHDAVVADRLTVEGNLNNVSMPLITNRYSFSNGTHIIKGDIHIANDMYITNLLVRKLFNEKVYLSEFLPSVVHRNDHANITGLKVFKNHVIFGKDVDVFETLNGFDVSSFVKDVVLVSRDSIVQGLVTFGDHVIVEGDLRVEGDVLTNYLDGCELAEWKANSVGVGELQLVRGIKSFESLSVPQGLTVETLNDLDLELAVTLGGRQLLPGTMLFESIVLESSDLLVDGLVNGVLFKRELLNTLMIEGNQEINTPTSFSSVHVRNSLKTTGALSFGADLHQLFTLDTEQIITTEMQLLDVQAPHVQVDGLVSGIDFNSWYDRSIFKNTKMSQQIDGKWLVDDVTFLKHIVGNNLLNNVDLRKLADDLARNRILLDSLERDLKADYLSLCTDVQFILEHSRKQLYKFKYFESMQIIDASDTESILLFEFENSTFLAVNNGGSCTTVFYKWIPENANFIQVFEFATGSVQQWLPVRNADGAFLVTNSINAGACLNFGAKIWRFSENGLQHFFTIELPVYSMQTGNDGAFYVLGENGVTEFIVKRENSEPSVENTWIVVGDDLEFVPYKTGLGLALSDGKRVSKLTKNENVRENSGPSNEPVISQALPSTGVLVTECPYLPQRGAGEVVVVTVGLGSSLRQLVAVTSQQNTRVRGKHDYIKIYEDVVEGRLFQTLPCLRPSSLTGIELGTGQTLLTFIEDGATVQIYAYHGIEGFRPLYQYKVPAIRLNSVVLPVPGLHSKRNFLLVSSASGVEVLEALMHGDTIEMDDLVCNVPY